MSGQDLTGTWTANDGGTYYITQIGNSVFWAGLSDDGGFNNGLRSIEFFKMFPDNHLINNPYKIIIAEGDYTCSVADFTGTFQGPMKGLDGKTIQPTNKKFHFRVLYRCPLAERKNSGGEVTL